MFDRLIQLIGFLVLTGIAVAVLLAVRAGMIPSDQDDVFNTVYAYEEPEAPSDDVSDGTASAESGSETADGR